MADNNPSVSDTGVASQEASALRLGALLHGAARERLSQATAPEREAATRLAGRMAARAVRPVSPFSMPARWKLAIGLALAATLAAVGLWTFLPSMAARSPLRLTPPSSPAIVFGVFDAGAPRPGQLGRVYTATSQAPMTLRFTAGERIVLTPGASAAVLSAAGPSHRMRLLAGTLQVSIPTQGPHHWTLLAGAFRVKVTGTSFALRYSPGPSARLEVLLRRGSVRVHGPALPPTGRTVRTGEPLHLQRSHGRWQWIAVTHKSPADPPVRQTSGSGSSQPPPQRVTPSLPASTWTRWYDAGRYKLLLADAKRRGLPGRLATLQPRTLWLLAQAARYAGAPRLALASLKQLRRRHASSRRAREASYIMARIHHDQLRQPGPACRLYARYLKESPSGVLREEALGRRIDACRKAGRLVDARKAARAYLQRYPRGIFRDLAQRTLRSKSTR